MCLLRVLLSTESIFDSRPYTDGMLTAQFSTALIFFKLCDPVSTVLAPKNTVNVVDNSSLSLSVLRGIY